MMTVLLLHILAPFAQLGDEDWRCVASEDGRDWECGQGDAAPQRRPLPDSLQPLGSAPRSARPATDTANAPGPAESESVGREPIVEPPPDPQIYLPAPRSAAGPAPDDRPFREAGYALQLATVASPEAIAEFATSFEVDFQRASRAAVIESGVRRQALLYGRYDSPAEARSAIEQLPALLQALRPRVVAITDLAGAPIELASRTQATVSHQRADASEPQSADAAAAVERPAADPATPRGPRREANADQRRDTATELRSQAAQPVLAETAAATSPSAQSRAPAQSPASGPTPSGRPAPPAATPNPRNEPDQHLPGHAAFADEQGRYTIQLANLGDPRAVAEFIARHRLSGHSIYGLEQADGRILVVLGRYENLSAAEAALVELPPSVSAPWIRRANPLLP